MQNFSHPPQSQQPGPSHGDPAQAPHQHQHQQYQQPYPQQHAGYGQVGPAGPAVAPGAKGFVAALFDFKFDHFITAKVMKIVYGFLLVVIGIGFLAAEYRGFELLLSSDYGPYVQDEAWRLILVAPFVAPFMLIVARIYCELLVVFVRMAEYLRDIATSLKARDASS